MLQGTLPAGDPDFDSLQVIGGTGFGLPSPGQTTLTQLGPPGSDWQVDSFFDITYQIDFVGAPGGAIGALSGSTIGTIHMQTGLDVCPLASSFCQDRQKADCVITNVTDESCWPQAVRMNAAGALIVDACSCFSPGGCGPVDITPIGVPPTDFTLSCPGICPSPVSFCQLFFDGLPTGQTQEVASNIPAGVVVTCGCPCASNADCDDGDPCTTDTCRADGTCDHVPIAGCCTNDAQCDDGDPCTTDTCDPLTGTCTHTPIPGCCTSNADCDDGDPCTIDTCDPVTGTCVFTPDPNCPCQPNADGSACVPIACAAVPEDRCLPTCVDYDPTTGITTIRQCDCLNAFPPEACHVGIPGSGGASVAAVAGPGGPCVVPDDGTGTVTLPPVGCDYLSPDEVHEIIDGLPAGTTIELAAIHKDFICQKGGADRFPGCPPPGLCEDVGGDLGGKVDCFQSTLQLQMTGTGTLAGFNRLISVPVMSQVHTGPRTPAEAVQDFDTDMFLLQGQIFGDPDFDVLRVTGGTGFGLPSPGHTTLTQLPGGNFAVDSFFDITYQIDFVGAPGSILEGLSGSTTGTIRMQTGAAPSCKGTCPVGETCHETRVVDPATGIVNLCCTCAAAPTGACCDPATAACSQQTQLDCEGAGGLYQGDGTLCRACSNDPTLSCTTDAQCPAPGTCVDQIVCPPPQCSPNADGSACNSIVCPVTGETCRPTVLQVLPGAAPVVLECECLGDNDCHVEFDAAAGPTCVGGCPPGQTCEMSSQDTDGDGIDDVFRCDCVCEPCIDPHCCDNPAATTLTGGIDDNFAPPPEPASPSAALTASIINRDVFGRPPMDFDEIPGETVGLDGQPTGDNRYFGHTFTNLPPNVVAATLEMRIRLTTANPIGATDSISLWLDGNTDTFAWSRRIEDLTGGPGTWTIGGSVATLTLDLAALPLPDGSTRCILPQINGSQRLDVMVQDDTGVDFLRLTVDACPCVEPPPGMVAWWPGDDCTPYDAVDAHDGTFAGTPFCPLDWKVGGGALGFNTGTYVIVPDHPDLDLGTGDLTIDAWVKCPTTAAVGVRPIVDKRNEGTQLLLGYTLFAVDGRLGFQMADASFANCLCGNNPGTSACTNFIAPLGSTNVCDGTWHHVAVTVERANPVGGRLFVDGAVEHTFNPTVRPLSLDNAANLWIGRRHPNPCAPADRYWIGEMDEIEIFKRALSAAEIAGIFNADRAGKCKDCAPTPDESACRKVACPDPTQTCRPTLIAIDPATGAVRVLECGCDPCHVEFNAAAGPFCVGTCPPGKDCTLFGEDLDGDGIDDQFHCGCGPAPCEPTADGSGCKQAVCPQKGCFGECINGSYCDNPDCCIDPNACQCYAPNTKESIKHCGDCFGECVGGAYCDDPANPACCIGGACACYLPNTDISLQLCGDCFGECINGSYCDPPNPDCCIVPGACACYLPDDPISLKLCADQPVTRPNECLPRCVNFDPLTGATKVTGCDCTGIDDCHVKLPGAVGGLARGGAPCIVPDDGSGTVTLPPPGCPYLSPEEVHEIIEGLPVGTKLELAPIHQKFIIRTSGPGGNLGGEFEQFDSILQLNVTGNATGSLAGFNRTLFVPLSCEAHIGPRTPGDPVQDFDTDMFRCQGQLGPGDPDFCKLEIVAGTDNGLPSPGHTTLTQLPSGDFAVDSFFDITYEIDFEGCVGSLLEGAAGITQAKIRMQTGGAPGCAGKCLPGEKCVETRTLRPDGTFDVCCDCVCPAPKTPDAPNPLDVNQRHAAQAKNRYLSFVPTNPGQQTALQVTLVSSTRFPGAVGSRWWVGPPQEVCENSGQASDPPPPPPGCGPAAGVPATMLAAKLQCNPHCMDWGALGRVVHVSDPGIVPDAVYEIRAIDCACDPNDPANFSGPLAVPTSQWGDLVSDCTTCPCGPPNGTVDVPFDCVAILDKFSNDFCAPIKSRTDIDPADPNRVIDISDAVRCLDAFGGLPYPFPAPVGCP